MYPLHPLNPSAPGQEPAAPDGAAAEPPRPAPYACASCASAGCMRGDRGRMPVRCPTRTHAEIAGDAGPYLDGQAPALMRAADQAPRDAEGKLRNRVEELLFLAAELQIKCIGIAFCVSLTKEAQALGKRLRAAGIEPELICCRVGAIDQDAVGLAKAHPEHFSSTCNPIAQARLLNERGVDLVVQIGLCLGHDLLLARECRAPVTTLVVKDRALDHNPVRALREGR